MHIPTANDSAGGSWGFMGKAPSEVASIAKGMQDDCVDFSGIRLAAVRADEVHHDSPPAAKTQ
jgi:hypothetical protein